MEGVLTPEIWIAVAEKTGIAELRLTTRDIPDSVATEFTPALLDGQLPWQPDASDGRTLFDTPQAEDGTVTVVFPQAKFSLWRSQALLKIDQLRCRMSTTSPSSR